jgi:AbrB family looped-hinge helix DNA binding protein
MARVTSKLQVTVPKRIADAYGIRPGDELEFVAAGDVIRVLPPGAINRPLDVAERLRLFDQATSRQRKRQTRRRKRPASTRGSSREDLYDRGRAR